MWLKKNHPKQKKKLERKFYLKNFGRPDWIAESIQALRACNSLKQFFWKRLWRGFVCENPHLTKWKDSLQVRSQFSRMLYSLIFHFSNTQVTNHVLNR
jgi:hypothetical protein